MTPVSLDLIRDADGAPIAYFPNTGNAGDSLIAAATFQFLERNGIPFEAPSHRGFDPTGRTVVLGGGGNLVGRGTTSWRLMSTLHARAKRLVLLPHTIKAVDDLLAAFGDNVDLVCRERVSYDYVAKSGTRARVHLADDMALSADVDELMTTPTGIGSSLDLLLRTLAARVTGDARVSLSSARNGLLAPFRAAALKPLDPRMLNALRIDGERTEIALAPDNIDLSTALASGAETRFAARLAAARLLKAIAPFETVSTNRLHVCIASALLGKTVHFHANSYYKCRAVWDYSLKDRFPNIKWMD